LWEIVNIPKDSRVAAEIPKEVFASGKKCKEVFQERWNAQAH
jgi:hypothetical protein